MTVLFPSERSASPLSKSMLLTPVAHTLSLAVPRRSHSEGTQSLDRLNLSQLALLIGPTARQRLGARWGGSSTDPCAGCILPRGCELELTSIKVVYNSASSTGP